MVVDLMHVSFGCPCDLSYGVQWDRVKPLFNSEHQSLDDGQCERQFKPERRPLTGLGFYRNGPLQTMENALHHIHPDSPAGDLGNFLSSAETGLEDVFEHLGFAKPRGFFCPDQSNFDSFGAYFAYIDAATIVADSHNHLIAVMISIELDCALGWLAGLNAFLGRLNSVSHRVTDHVGQRFCDGVEDALVEVRVLSADDQFHFLATLPSHIPHHARKAPK